MRKIYINYKYIGILVLVALLTACGEPEDVVKPQATCDTVATVHNEPGRGIWVVLEDGRVFAPTNAKITRVKEGNILLEIGGFPVKEGQQIIMGYLPAGNLESSKKIDVNCIVGIVPKAAQ